MTDLILLHGAIGAADQLHTLATHFKKDAFRVHVLNFSGHGKEPFAEGFGIEAFAGELDHYIHTNKLKTPAVFGYSMGGYVALYLAVTKPGTLGRMATLGTKFDWTPQTAAKEMAMLDPATILAKVPKFAAALEARHGGIWQLLLSKTAAMIEGLGKQPLLTPAVLQAIPNPVCVGLADHDQMVSLEETLSAYRQLQQGCLYVLPNSRHPIEQVDSTLLAQILTHFFHT